MTTSRLEDRYFGTTFPTLNILPPNLWGFERKLEQHLGVAVWHQATQHIAARVQQSCELCGASGTQEGAMGMRAHKFKLDYRFSHDVGNNIAMLQRIVHVCMGCHQAAHLRQTQRFADEQPAYGASALQRAMARLRHFHGMDDLHIQAWLDRELAQAARWAAVDYPTNIDVAFLESTPMGLWA